MAPDLNSVPPSPRIATGSSVSPMAQQQSSTPASRRTSQIFPMSPPPLPLASPGGSLPQTTHAHSAFPPVSPGASASVHSVDATGVPMRHPRPMTAAELHLELEKEQEAVVNRLTRELSALRAHSASVASTASSSASGPVLFDGTDPSLVGATHPTASRRHRSSSSVSRTSMSASYNGPTSFTTGIPLGASATSVPHQRYSVSSHTSAMDSHNGQHRASLTTSRLEEVAHYKQELEEAKRENDRLRARVKDLERMLNGRRSSSSETGSRGRSEGRQERATATPAVAAPANDKA